MANHKEDIQKELLSTYKSLLESRDDMIKLISHPFFTDEETLHIIQSLNREKKLFEGSLILFFQVLLLRKN